MILIGIALIVIGIAIIWRFTPAGMDGSETFKMMAGQCIGNAFIIAGVVLLMFKLIGIEVSIQ